MEEERADINQAAPETESAGPVEPPRPRWHWWVIFLVSSALFIAALAWPLHLQYRHLRSFKYTTDAIGKAVQYPLDEYVEGRTVPRNTKKVGAAIFAIVLLAAGRLIPRRKKVAQWAVTILLALLTVSAFHTESYQTFRQFLDGKYVQFWNVYHYYFGAKYFDEMGYFYQYAYTFKAADEGAFKIDYVTVGTDLFDYRVKPRAEITAQVEGRNDFKKKRWNKFKREMRVVAKHINRRYWKEMMRDHGYNGTPFWSTFGGALADLFPFDRDGPRTFVLSLDMLLLLATFVVVGWAFGPRWGIVSAFFFLTYYGNENYTVAGYLRYDWFCATMTGFALFHKKKYYFAAPFFAFAAMTRIFPGVLLLGPGLKWLVQWIRTKQMDRKLFAMFVIFTVCCALFFSLGMLNRHGFGAWKQFYTNIKQHAAKHYVGPKRMGLKHMFIDDLRTPKIAKDPRYPAFNRQKTTYRAMQLMMFAMFLLMLWRRNYDDALLLGFFFIFPLQVLSRYYWALLGMMFLLRQDEKTPYRNLYGDVILLASIVFFYTFRFVERDPYSYYMVPTHFFLTYFLYLGGTYLIDDALFVGDWAKRRFFPAPAAVTPEGALIAEPELPTDERGPVEPIDLPEGDDDPTGLWKK